MSRSSMENCQASNALIEFMDFNSMLNYLDYRPLEVPFTQQNLPLIGRTLNRDVQLFMVISENIVPYFQPRQRYPDIDPIRVIINSSDPTVIFTNIKLITQKEAIPKTYVCKESEKCHMTFRRLDNFKRHCETCKENSTQKIIGKQIAYGPETNCVRILVDMGYLPVEALEYRKTFFCTYDIETLEDKSNIEDMRNVEAIHRLASISVSTTESRGKVFVRSDSSHGAAKKMVQDFLDYLVEIRDEQELILPDYLSSCMNQLEEDSNNESIPKSHRMKLAGLKSKVKKYLMLDCYGFNSGNTGGINSPFKIWAVLSCQFSQKPSNLWVIFKLIEVEMNLIHDRPLERFNTHGDLGA